LAEDKKTDSPDDGLPSVRYLALQLQERIKHHKGGTAGVWKQIDGRFKQEKSKSIKGRKEPHKNKISYYTFRRAVGRLSDEKVSDGLEKMTFQVNGNPLLLMNIFEILGISGYKDLLKLDFKRPDITDEIVNIGISLRKIKRNQAVINDRIEAGHKRIRTFKLNADFEEITRRLHSILNENEDPLLADPLYLEGKKISSENGNLNLLRAKMTGDAEKFRRKSNEYKKKFESITFFNTLKQGYLYGIEGEKKRVVLTAMIFIDYAEYIFNNPILKKCRDLLSALEPKSSIFELDFSYILSPFIIIFLYLQIAILFITRIYETSFFYDEIEKEDTQKLIGKDNLKEYLLNQLKHLFREIRRILTTLIKNKVDSIPQEKYEIYKYNAIQIIDILKLIFIDNKSVNMQKVINETGKCKTIEALFKARDKVYSGVYKINYNELERLELALNNILEIKRATERDLE
jgi:hypothetical protein